MKIKYINWITAIVILLQFMPSWIVFISQDVANQMVAQMMGKEITNEDAFLVFKTFMSVFGYIGLGLFILILGINKVKDLKTAQNLSFYLGLFMTFFALPDVVHMVSGTLPHQPVVMILINFIVAGLLFYGSKRGRV
jgi:hypothetical protein